MRKRRVSLIDVSILIALVLIIAVAVKFGKHTRESGSIERKQSAPMIDKRKGDFFSIGKYGKTLILEVNTERTNGKLEKQVDTTGKRTRVLDGSQDKKGSYGSL